MTEHANANHPKKTVYLSGTKTPHEYLQNPQASVNNPLLRQPKQIKALQRTIGNQSVMRLLKVQPSKTPSPMVQRGLEGEDYDEYKKNTMPGGPWYAVTLLIDIDDTLTEGSQWWVSQSDILSAKSAKGEAVGVYFTDGDGRVYDAKVMIDNLRYELSGEEKKEKEKKDLVEANKVNPLVREKFEAAVERHQRDRALVEEVMAAAETSDDTLLKNSVELVRERVVNIRILTTTHDSDERVREQGEKEESHALFQSIIGEAIPDEPYRWYDPTDRRDLVFIPKGKAGINISGQTDIYMINPGQWAEMGVSTTIAGNIKHEVQHAVDMHKRGDDDESWRVFKTEYRAYTAQGEFADQDDTLADQAVEGVAGFTRQQKALVEVIFAEYPTAKSGWDQNAFLDSEQKLFREAVKAFRGALSELSINPINSIRLLNFQQEVRQLAVVDNLDSPSIGRFIRDFFTPEGENPLDEHDKAVVAEGSALRALMSAHLHPDVLKRVVELASG